MTSKKEEEDELYQKATQAYQQIAEAVHGLVDQQLLELHQKAEETEARVRELTKKCDEYESRKREASREDEDDTTDDTTFDDITDETKDATLQEEEPSISVNYEGRDPQRSTILAYRELLDLAARQKKREGDAFW